MNRTLAGILQYDLPEIQGLKRINDVFCSRTALRKFYSKKAPARKIYPEIKLPERERDNTGRK